MCSLITLSRPSETAREADSPALILPSLWRSSSIDWQMGKRWATQATWLRETVARVGPPDKEGSLWCRMTRLLASVAVVLAEWARTLLSTKSPNKLASYLLRQTEVYLSNLHLRRLLDGRLTLSLHLKEPFPILLIWTPTNTHVSNCSEGAEKTDWMACDKANVLP